MTVFRHATIALAMVGALLALPVGARADGVWPDTVASESSFVSVVGDSGDFVTGGSDSLFRTADGGAIHVYYNLSHEVEVDVTGPQGNHYELTFAAPPGEDLAPGTYANAQRTPFRDAGRPGIDVTGNGNGCNDTEGQFTVLDAPADLSRLWIVYHASCSAPDGVGVSGEIKYEEPGDGSSLVVAPDRIDWARTYPHVRARTTPVTLINIGEEPVSLGSARVSDGAEDFSVDQGSCAEIAPGGTCKLSADFVPSTSGPRHGSLEIPVLSNGTTRTVELNGIGEHGYTSFDARSQVGDKVGQGRRYSYWPGTAGINAHGNGSQFEVNVLGGNGEHWTADAFAAPGDTFTAGSSYPLTPTNSGTGTEFAADISGRGCYVTTGRLTVHQIALDQAGAITALSATFVQRCQGSTAALAGSVAWRANEPAAAVPTLAPRASFVVARSHLTRRKGGPRPGARVLAARRPGATR